MNYAPVTSGTPEDFTVSQSRQDGCLGGYQRCCEHSGPWGVDLFASCFAAVWGCVLACCEGVGSCCGGCGRLCLSGCCLC